MRLLLTISALALGPTAQAWGEEATGRDGVTIVDAWAKAPDAVTGTSAVYMSLEVAGGRSDRLLGATTAAAADAELHTFWLEGCFVHRRSVEAIELASDRRTVLDPGGLHILLTGVRPDVVEGGTIGLSLNFEKAGSVAVEVPVEAEVRRRVDSGAPAPGGQDDVPTR